MNDTQGNEMIKALISKVIELGTAVKDTGELIRQLPNPQEPLERFNEQLGTLAANILKMEASMKGMDRQLVGMGALQEALDRHAQLFEKPLEKTVHYRHFLGKPVVVFLAMGLCIVVLTTLWVMGWNGAAQYRENDLKWRYAKLLMNVPIQVMVDSAERRYEADPGQFKKDVIAEEERQRELTEYMIRQEELDSAGARLKRGKKIQ
jgi:hypothetical protein